MKTLQDYEKEFDKKSKNWFYSNEYGNGFKNEVKHFYRTAIKEIIEELIKEPDFELPSKTNFSSSFKSGYLNAKVEQRQRAKEIGII